MVTNGHDAALKPYEVSRGSPGRLKINTIRGNEVEFFIIDPETSALDIADMQNFFLEKAKQRKLSARHI